MPHRFANTSRVFIPPQVGRTISSEHRSSRALLRPPIVACILRSYDAGAFGFGYYGQMQPGRSPDVASLIRASMNEHANAQAAAHALRPNNPPRPHPNPTRPSARLSEMTMD